MLGLVKSCIGTKFTGQFGDLIAVSIPLSLVLGFLIDIILCSYLYLLSCLFWHMANS